MENQHCPNCYGSQITEEGLENICRQCGYIWKDQVIITTDNTKELKENK